MRVSKALGLLVVGAGVAWYVSRQATVGSPQSADPGPRTPEVETQPAAVEPFVPSEQPTREQPAVEREGEAAPVDVTDVVDDLVPSGDGSVVDAEVVDDEGWPPPA